MTRDTLVQLFPDTVIELSHARMRSTMQRVLSSAPQQSNTAEHNYLNGSVQNSAFQLQTVTQGQWMQLTPEYGVKRVRFYQSVITMTQVCAEVQALLKNEFGIALHFSEVRAVIDAALESACALYEGTVNLNLEPLRGRFVHYRTFVEEVVQPGACRVFCKDPDKLVFAEAETEGGMLVVSSRPVGFSERPYAAAELVRAGDALVAVYYTTETRDVIEYTFLQGGTVV